MPEQITKYPDVTLKVLKGAGAVCGEGAPQKILTQCPAERFCSLPTGEICGLVKPVGTHNEWVDRALCNFAAKV